MRKEEVPMATQDSPNLYERLGGAYSIATVVDDLIDRVMADQWLNANPLVDDAHHKVPPAGFKYLVTESCAGPPEVRRITPASYFADEAISQDDEAILKPTAFIKGLVSVSARIGPNYRSSRSIFRIV
jgi:hypothetical protein